MNFDSINGAGLLLLKIGVGSVVSSNIAMLAYFTRVSISDKKSFVGPV